MIIELDSIDSTNNYAMQLIDADKAQPGMTIVAQSQTEGKGQRGKAWVDEPGQSLLMSIITTPARAIREQFAFNAGIAVVIANVLQKLSGDWDLRIKWPNDMIINDKKAGGILIENVLRGSRWMYSVIGIGINVKQRAFPENLPFATSLKKASGNDFDITGLRDSLIENVMTCATNPVMPEQSMKVYNELLYKKGKQQRFRDGNSQWDATIINAHADGTLEVQLEDGAIVFYHHGQVMWEWG
jgi:BirA family transcriptional regulator, biotin operon repressor / biotin---[acetyl-CoA-carboxylase] ligase